MGGALMRLKKRFLAMAALIGAVAALGTAIAVAASPHFLHGSTPTCTFSTTGTATDTVTCSGGTIAGLGNADLQLQLSGSGFATFTCTNKGGNTAPGQNKVPVSVTPESEIVPGSSIKNGSVTLPTVGPATVPTPTATASEAGCPNNNWTATVASIGITDVLLVISQPPGTPIFNCTAHSDTGFTDGQTVALTCTRA
jgi:hypothetical protein